MYHTHHAATTRRRCSPTNVSRSPLLKPNTQNQHQTYLSPSSTITPVPNYKHDTVQTVQTVQTLTTVKSVKSVKTVKSIKMATDSCLKKVMVVFMIIWSLMMISWSILSITQIKWNQDNDTTRNDKKEDHNAKTQFMTKVNNAPICTPSSITTQEIQYTLVIHSSEDRLWMMEHHCKRWGYTNPISIAVFTNQEVDDIYLKLVALGCLREYISLTVQRMAIDDGDVDVDGDGDVDVDVDQYHLTDTRSKTLRLTSEQKRPDTVEGTSAGTSTGTAAAAAASMVHVEQSNKQSIKNYPINKLRNMALSAVKTSHVLQIDIDFFESNDLYHTLQRKDIKETLAQDAKVAIVIPAFQLNRRCSIKEECDEDNIAQMPYTKEELEILIRKEASHMFDPTNRGGHGTTNYKAWFLDSDDGLLDIPCIKSKRYEPYVVLRYCDIVPPFQERFNGYGKNKLSWFQHLNRVGYTMKQINHAFIVHYPHDDSKSRIQWNKHPDRLKHNMKTDNAALGVVNWSAYKRGRVDALYVEFQNWLESEVVDNTSIPMCTMYDHDSNLWVHNREQPK